MPSFERLRANGYSNQDILDMICMFEKQIINFIENIDNLRLVEIAEELHRLKGGCDLLYLYDFTNKIAEIKNSAESHEICIDDKILTTTLNELRNFVVELKSQVNSS